MRGFRYQGQMLYLEATVTHVPSEDERVLRSYSDHPDHPIVHLVSVVYWRDYLVKRLRVPDLCVLFGTLEQRELAVPRWQEAER